VNQLNGKNKNIPSNSKEETQSNLNFRVMTDPLTGEMTIDKQHSPKGKRKRAFRSKTFH
jgi:hypothetical protein